MKKQQEMYWLGHGRQGLTPLWFVVPPMLLRFPILICLILDSSTPPAGLRPRFCGQMILSAYDSVYNFWI